MDPNAEPLQGSLFGDAIEPLGKSKATPKGSQVKSKDFSDEELLKDSTLRPRKRQQPKFDLEQSKRFDQI